MKKGFEDLLLNHNKKYEFKISKKSNHKTEGFSNRLAQKLRLTI